MDQGILVVAACFVAGGVAGVVTGRAWIVPVPLLIVVGFIPAGEDSDGTPEFVWASILLVLPMLVGAVIGLAGRRLGSGRADRGARSS